uniref:Uncharacterized protein n=1 Tax=Anguilla anguilla TaxID=7936 RepID=A0A0E9RCR1_ANGAN
MNRPEKKICMHATSVSYKQQVCSTAVMLLWVQCYSVG